MGAMSFVTPVGKALKATIKRLLGDRDYNRHELGDALLVSDHTARKYLKELHAAGEIHVNDWRPWHSDTWLLACYIWGAGEDAPKPKYDQKRINGRTRARIRADIKAHDLQRAADRQRRTPEQKAAEYQRWKDENPEAYRTKQQTANQRKREARLKRILAEEEARRERARIEALRGARRDAKAIPNEEERERFVKVETIVRNPQPDPLVAMFFGKSA